MTILTSDRRNLFGVVEQGMMQLNQAGQIANLCWQKIPEYYPNVELDEFVIMPNHIHGILHLTSFPPPSGTDLRSGTDASRKGGCMGGSHPPLLPPNPDDMHRSTLSSVVRGFKSGVTRWFNRETQIKTVWHRSFHDHIIRSDQQLEQIRQYIRQNPLKWALDCQNQNKPDRLTRESVSEYGCEKWMV